MSSTESRTGLLRAALIGAVIGLNGSLAQAQIPQPNGASVAYVAPEKYALQDLYDLLRSHRALERLQEILSPLRRPEELTIKTAECKEVNSWYRREDFKPTVIICYEFLKHILEPRPPRITLLALRPADAAVGQFFWTALHEIGHAVFDILDVPIFGHEEDSADNFATYISPTPAYQIAILKEGGLSDAKKQRTRPCRDCKIWEDEAQAVR
jgi:hypothetical protein